MGLGLLQIACLLGDARHKLFIQVVIMCLIGLASGVGLVSVA